MVVQLKNNQQLGFNQGSYIIIGYYVSFILEQSPPPTLFF